MAEEQGSEPMGEAARERTSQSADPRETDPELPRAFVRSPHPGFATTALGPADVRDTPRVPSLVDEEPDPWIGRVLANVYRVEVKIGEGGMGSVYAARHVHLNKQYAVKVLGKQIAESKTAVERLKQEAIAASSIDHDNIVDVTNFDTADDGSVFIVMELLRGESLASRLGRGAMKAHEVVGIAQQICGALGAAHQRGIVHRDLKPENVFLTKKGSVERVKVLDFGISKVKSAEAEGVRMTRTGQLVGTPLYMSPEQARGETEIDRRVDIYALGVMLYEMLTGVPPFDGRNYFELLWKHGNEAPEPLEKRNPNVFLPEGLGAVVLRTLAKDREERFQTMEELAEALHTVMPDVPMGPVSLPPGVSSSSDALIRVSVATPQPAGKSENLTSAERKAVHTAFNSSDALAPPPNRLPMQIGIGVVVVGLIAVGAYALGAGGSSPTPSGLETHVPPSSVVAAPPSTVVAEVPPSHVEEEPPVGVDPPSPTLVTVSFGSTPPGAEVRRGDQVLCTTPCMQDLPPEEIALVFRHDGFYDETTRVTPSEDAPVQVRLRPRRRAADGVSPSGAPHIKTEL
jgi:serine/threonine-protein kinase